MSCKILKNDNKKLKKYKTTVKLYFKNRKIDINIIFLKLIESGFEM